MSTPDLTQFDVIFEDMTTGEEHGYVVSWEGDQPFALVVDEQTVPGSIGSGQEDENYGFRDLQDTWRISFTNFTGGEGQRRRDVTSGSISKYYQSTMIDTSQPGDLRLHHTLRSLTHPLFTSYLAGNMVMAHGEGHESIVCWRLDKSGGWANDRIGQVYIDSGTWFYREQPTGSGASLTALASDGKALYAAYSGGTPNAQGIFRHDFVDPYCHRISSEADGDTMLVNHMACSAGTVYLSTGRKLGYLSGTEGSMTFANLSPAALVSSDTECFGLETVGNWVYWGVRSGERSIVYAAQWDAGTGVKNFLTFVELPTGFIGTALCGYLGNLYIGGYYESHHYGVGQGAVYLASNDGIALLTKVGEDPNEYPGTPGDTFKNQIVAAYAYDHWLYLLTQRSLWRWDLRAGGLNHIAEVGTFAASGGSPGTLITTPWSLAGAWPELGYAIDAIHDLDSLPLSDLETSTRTTYVDYLKADGNFTDDSNLGSWVRVFSDTADLHGDNVWRASYFYDTSFNSGGGCVNFTASHFHRDCLEVYVGTSTQRAQVMFYGREDTDNVLVQVMNESGTRTTIHEYQGRNAVHEFHLTCDAATGTGRLWMDGTLRGEWRMPTSAYANGIGYVYGNHLTPRSTTYPHDWRVCLRTLRWASGGGFDPGWMTGVGVTGATSFCVAAGSPYVPAAIAAPGASSGNHLITTDWTSYATSGHLHSSTSSGKMPTVNKYVVALDVYHEPVNAGESILVTPVIDGKPQATFTIGETSVRLSSMDLYGYAGTEVGLEIELRSPGTSTPVFHGGSLRFTPLDNSYYVLRLDLREPRRDNSGLPIDTAADLVFLKELAESKRTVNMTSRLESCKVRASTLQFHASPAQIGGEVNPQGIALLKLKRVP